MRNLNRIVIIGTGAAGLTTAESLRRLGFGGKIMIVHAENTPPYDRPPLSKQVLASTWPPEKVLLRSPAALEKLALDWHHGVYTIPGNQCRPRTPKGFWRSLAPQDKQPCDKDIKR